MAVIASVWTVVLQKSGGAMIAGQRVLSLTFADRLSNAIVSVPRYVYKIAVPTGLSIFYPHPGHWPVAVVIAAALFILVVTATTFALRRRFPYLLVGWLWFGTMLAPVSGIVQVGLQSIADRYTYLPSIGLAIAAVWAGAEIVRRAPIMRLPALGALGGSIAAIAFLTRVQVLYWSSTFDLFSNALEENDSNFFAHDVIGRLLLDGGETQEALVHFEKSVRSNPNYDTARHNYGLAFFRLGRLDEAIEQDRQAVRLSPELLQPHLLLGEALGRQGHHVESDAEFAKATEIKADDSTVWYLWGSSLVRQGRRAEAIARFAEATRISPSNAPLQENIAADLADSAAGTTRPMTAATRPL